jgi:regulator of RNase E activity RraB
MKSFASVLTLVVLGFSSPGFAQSVAEQQDAEVIENLRASGSDLSKPHDVDFFFYFASKAHAERAAQELAAASYRGVTLERGPEGRVWQVHTKRMMVPRLDAMSASTRALEALAARHGGEYDGWGTAVVR